MEERSAEGEGEVGRTTEEVCNEEERCVVSESHSTAR